MRLMKVKSSSTNKINHIEEKAPLCEWAVKFIDFHQLSIDSFTNADAFKQLTRRQKDAIRYQMKKKRAQSYHETGCRPRARVKGNQLSRAYIAKCFVSIWITVFLIIDLVGIYQAKGMSLLVSWQAAVLVELCIIACAIDSRKLLQRLGVLLYIYNLLLFGQSEISQYRLVKEQNQIIDTQVQSKRRVQAKLQEQIERLTEREEQIFDSYKEAFGRGMITASSKAFNQMNSRISEDKEKLRNKILELEGSLETRSKEIKPAISAGIRGLLLFLMRAALQICSICFLRRGGC